jgi:hypothetical protein
MSEWFVVTYFGILLPLFVGVVYATVSLAKSAKRSEEQPAEEPPQPEQSIASQEVGHD